MLTRHLTKCAVIVAPNCILMLPRTVPKWSLETAPFECKLGSAYEQMFKSKLYNVIAGAHFVSPEK